MHLYHYSGFYLRHRSGFVDQTWMDGEYRAAQKIVSTQVAKKEIADSQAGFDDYEFTLVSFTYLYEIEE